MTQRLEGKIALITGASRGIGYAIAEAYAREGAIICLNARNADTLNEAAEQLRQGGATVSAYACDVVDRAGVDAMVEQITAEYGRIDVLVNNAGIYIASPFMQYSIEDFSRVIDVNVHGVFHVTQSVLAGMIDRKAGKIVNIASTAGKWGSRNQSAYNASKHAIVGLTRCLGLEMIAHNINVNAICPFFVETDMLPTALEAHAKFVGAPADAVRNAMMNMGPIKRFIQPEEVAQLAIYLGSNESDYVNCQSFVIDGGYTMV